MVVRRRMLTEATLEIMVSSIDWAAVAALMRRDPIKFGNKRS